MGCSSSRVVATTDDFVAVVVERHGGRGGMPPASQLAPAAARRARLSPSQQQRLDTELLTAVRKMRGGTVHTLLAAGASANAVSGDGRTALHLACLNLSHADEETQSALVHELLAAGADVTKPSDTGAVPLHYAVDGRNTEIVTALLQVAGVGSTVNATTTVSGETPLHWASAYQMPDMVDALLAAGADVNAVTKEVGPGVGRRTPLLLAADANATAIVRRLLRAGADANIADAAGSTPLLLAAEYGNGDLVAALLDGGADVHATVAPEGRTPMFGAVMSFTPHRPIALTLIQAGATVDDRKFEGSTLLHHAVTRNAIPLLQPLIDAGAHVDVCTDAKPYAPTTTALQMAVGKLTGWGVLSQPPFGFPVNVTPVASATSATALTIIRILAAAPVDLARRPTPGFDYFHTYVKRAAVEVARWHAGLIPPKSPPPQRINERARSFRQAAARHYAMRENATRSLAVGGGSGHPTPTSPTSRPIPTSPLSPPRAAGRVSVTSALMAGVAKLELPPLLMLPTAHTGSTGPPSSAAVVGTVSPVEDGVGAPQSSPSSGDATVDANNASSVGFRCGVGGPGAGRVDTTDGSPGIHVSPAPRRGSWSHYPPMNVLELFASGVAEGAWRRRAALVVAFAAVRPQKAGDGGGATMPQQVSHVP